MKKTDLSLVISYLWLSVLLCLYQRSVTGLSALLLLAPVAIYLLSLLPYPMRNLGKVLRAVALILCPVLLIVNLLWVNTKPIQVSFSLYSLCPLFLLILTGVILWLQSSFDPKRREETQSSYNVFESWLSGEEIKIMYNHADGVLSGFLLPCIASILFFDSSAKIGCLVLFFCSLVGGLAYGRIRLRPLLKEKREREQKELEAEIRKEQGYFQR